MRSNFDLDGWAQQCWPTREPPLLAQCRPGADPIAMQLVGGDRFGARTSIAADTDALSLKSAPDARDAYITPPSQPRHRRVGGPPGPLGREARLPMQKPRAAAASRRTKRLRALHA